MAARKTKDAGVIELQRLKDSILEVHIKGLTPVIPHRWSEKAKAMMPGHPDSDNVKKKKGLRNPKEEAEACTYYLGKKAALPAVAFKAALVGACRFFEKPTMVEAKQMLYVEGEGPEQLVPIDYKEKLLREDTPRNSNGGADLRYRNSFVDWSAKLRVKFVPTTISAESVVALVDAAGRGGVCDWRPSAPKSYTGTYGTWRVDDSKEIKVLDK